MPDITRIDVDGTTILLDLSLAEKRCVSCERMLPLNAFTHAVPRLDTSPCGHATSLKVVWRSWCDSCEHAGPDGRKALKGILHTGDGVLV